MSRKGKDLELLVAQLESYIDADVRIKSPDYIEDRLTKKKREVDISLRKSVGSVEILVVIECRDRKSVEDTTWIEQLATKHRDIQANKVIAVSSNRFTKEAIQKANAYNIDIRTVKELTLDDISSWFTGGTLELITRMAYITHVRIGLDIIDKKLEKSILKEIVPISIEKEIFIIKQTGDRASLQTVWSNLPKETNDDIFRDVLKLPVGEKIPMNVKLDFISEDRYQVISKIAPIDVKQIVLRGFLWCEHSKVPHSSAISYVDIDSSKLDVVEFAFPINNREHTLSVVRDNDKEVMSFNLKRSESNDNNKHIPHPK